MLHSIHFGSHILTRDEQLIHGSLNNLGLSATTVISEILTLRRAGAWSKSANLPLLLQEITSK